jgi:hypothetical protein
LSKVKEKKKERKYIKTGGKEKSKESYCVCVLIAVSPFTQCSNIFEAFHSTIKRAKAIFFNDSIRLFNIQNKNVKNKYKKLPNSTTSS